MALLKRYRLLSWLFVVPWVAGFSGFAAAAAADQDPCQDSLLALVTEPDTNPLEAVSPRDEEKIAEFLEEPYPSSDLTNRAQAEKVEREAIQALHDLVITPDKARRSVRAWFEQVRSRPLSVMEHTTLVHLLRSGFLRDDPDASLAGEMRASVLQSWFRFAGEKRDIDFVLDHPLPESVLRNASRDERLFQARVMEMPRDSVGSSANPGENDKLSAEKSAALRAGAFKGLSMAAVGLAVTSGAAHQIPGGDVLAGGILGYITASHLEYALHRFSMHATPEMLRKYQKLGFIGKIIERAQRNHLQVHHSMFKPDRYTEDASEEWAKAERVLDEDGKPTELRIVPKYDKLLDDHGHKKGEGQRNKYGLTLDNIALANVEMVMLPVATALSYTFFGFHDLPAWLALNGGVQYAVFGVRTLHGYLHMRPEFYPPAMKFLLKFSWVRDYLGWVSRHHFQHHTDMRTNFPLFAPFFPNGKEPDLKALLQMWSLGVLR